MYIPNPIRCRSCFKFGHFADKCTKEPICSFCSKPTHDGEDCKTIIPNCVNCGNPHSSLDINCPRLQEEKEIKTIQFKEKVPYNVARRKYKENLHINGSKSFAEAAKHTRKVGVEIGTQTDVFISVNSSNIKLIKPSTSKDGITYTGLKKPLLLLSPSPGALPPPLPPGAPTPPRPITPLLPPTTPLLPPTTPLPPLLAGERTPRSPSPRGSNSNAPQPLSGDESTGIFKVPLPQRNSTHNKNRKSKKNNGDHPKNDDEMETT